MRNDDLYEQLLRTIRPLLRAELSDDEAADLRLSFDNIVECLEQPPLESILADAAGTAHSLARSKGWWDEGQDHIAIKLYKLVEEITELGREFAQHTSSQPSPKIPEYTRAEEEWADIFWRWADIGGRYGFDACVVPEKLAYNRTRTHRHGGLAF